MTAICTFLDQETQTPLAMVEVQHTPRKEEFVVVKDEEGTLFKGIVVSVQHEIRKANLVTRYHYLNVWIRTNFARNKT